MYLIKCPSCSDIWFTEKKYKNCKCFRCGHEYKPNHIFIFKWIYEAIKRCKG